MYLKVASAYIHNEYPKTEFYFWILVSQKNPVLSHLTGTILQDDIILTFNFMDL